MLQVIAQAPGTITDSGASNAKRARLSSEPAFNRVRVTRLIMATLVLRLDGSSGRALRAPRHGHVRSLPRTTKARIRLHAEAGKC
jgi:hypothetical protein